MASYTIQRKGPSLIVGEQYFRIAASLFTLWSCAEIIVIVAAGRKYALRINAGFGTTKAIISSDRAALEQARRRINELLSSQEGE